MLAGIGLILIAAVEDQSYFDPQIVSLSCPLVQWNRLMAGLDSSPSSRETVVNAQYELTISRVSSKIEPCRSGDFL